MSILNPAEVAGNSKLNSQVSSSRKMAGRYHAMFPRYKEKTQELLANAIRGKNNFLLVEAKSDAVNNTTGVERNYVRTLTSSVTLNVPVGIDHLTKTVCDARAKHGLERLKGNVQKQCMEEIYKAFIVHVVMLPGSDGKNHRAYVPKFALFVE